ncbi:hypothetical protein Trco_007499 [Trichoderma cornu-damae]|uniref:Uncharacterized protein n=1 Tax=Trichoderma cornu-damae TaxID=654480 RepID=A0A9P8QJC5_9HYPO|nr:hypothetical protein Trco_007499 [Trichoderma cornu-damae]
MLLTPFSLHWAWRNATVTFDKEPKRKNTSFITLTGAGSNRKAAYHGYKALFATARAYTEQLMRQGTMWRSQEASVPNFEGHDSISARWAAQAGKHNAWKAALEPYLNLVIATSEDFPRIIDSVTQSEANPLLSTIRCRRHASPRNGFLRRHQGCEVEAGYEGFEIGHWHWNHDFVRRQYWDWSWSWHNLPLKPREPFSPDSSSDALVVFSDGPDMTPAEERAVYETLMRNTFEMVGMSPDEYPACFHYCVEKAISTHVLHATTWSSWGGYKDLSVKMNVVRQNSNKP